MKVTLSDENRFNQFKGIISKSGNECQKISWMSAYIPTVKHGSRFVIIWGCFCGNETGMLVRVSRRIILR